MKLLKFAGLVAISLSLSGCYTTKNNQLIPKGVQVLERDLNLCLRGDCITVSYADGRYSAERPFGADSQSVAFLPLMMANGRQIYIVEQREHGDSDTAYHVARIVDAPTPNSGDIEAALIFCDLDAAAIKELGWKKGYAPGSCEPSSLDSLNAFLIETYADEFASEAWWAEKKQPL